MKKTIETMGFTLLVVLILGCTENGGNAGVDVTTLQNADTTNSVVRTTIARTQTSIAGNQMSEEKLLASLEKCRGEQEENKRDGCYRNIALVTGDEEYCGYLNDENPCYFQLARKYSKADYCAGINDAAMKQKCETMAVNTENKPQAYPNKQGG